MSVKTAFVATFVVLFCLLAGLAFVTILAEHNHRQVALSVKAHALEASAAGELESLRQQGHGYTKLALLLIGLTALCTVWGFGFLQRRVISSERRDSEARVQGIVDSASDAIITFDHTGLIQTFNPAAEVMFGYLATDIIGRDITLLIPADDMAQHVQGLQNSLGHGERMVTGQRTKVEGQRQDHAVFPLELTMSATQQDQQPMFTAILRDLSTREAEEQHLQDLTQQLSGSSKRLESMMTAQASSTQQVVATAQEIAATSQELVQTMHDVTGMSADTATVAESGQASLASMKETMNTMERASHMIADRLGLIQERAANITTVITTITKVAEQTNLLSLNAAIEAEKAGEYGRGFAVVAREIRRLADQTAEATLDIEQMVQEMASAVSAGVVGMDQFAYEVKQGVQDVTTVSEQLNHIITQVQTLTPRFDTVHEGMQMQAEGAQQINESMVQLRDVTQQTMDSLRTSTQAIEQLHAMSQGLRNGTAQPNLSAAVGS